MSQADRLLLNQLLAQAKREDPVTVSFVRHGATRMNAESSVSVDRERGWSDVPLTEEGREEARAAAESLKDKGIGAIIASDLRRARQTAVIIGGVLGVRPKFSSKLRPWNLGDLTGKPMTEAKPQIAWYARHPDERVPGGETFNTFRLRAFQGLAVAIEKHSGKTVLIVAHHRVERLIAGWEKAGQPIEHAIDIRTFLAKGDPPGGIITLRTHRQLLDGEIRRKLSHVDAEYGKGRDGEFCRTCRYSDHQEAPTCCFVDGIARNGWCRLWTKDPQVKPDARAEPSRDEKKQAAFYG